MNRNLNSSERHNTNRDTKGHQSRQLLESSRVYHLDNTLEITKIRSLLESGSLKCSIDPRRPYIPVNPWKSPLFFPQKPMQQYLTPAFFLKLSEDTLFFIFYYFPNTLQQKLAARELKRLSWRFHKKYMSWFQRMEEPSRVTEAFEHGSFVCFDPEEWKKVVKQDFTFYYNFLD